MRISRLFIKHHSKSQLLCCSTECRDADVALSLRKGGKKKFYEMPERKKKNNSVTKTALKLASCWSPSLSASKPPWLKYLWKTSSERKWHWFWKKESKFVFIPVLLSSPSSPSSSSVQLPQLLLQWMHDACLHHTHLISQLIVDSWNSSFCISHGPVPPPHNSVLPSLLLLYIKVEKKLGCRMGRSDGCWNRRRTRRGRSWLRSDPSLIKV